MLARKQFNSMTSSQRCRSGATSAFFELLDPDLDQGEQ